LPEEQKEPHAEPVLSRCQWVVAVLVLVPSTPKLWRISFSTIVVAFISSLIGTAIPLQEGKTSLKTFPTISSHIFLNLALA
jgi:hypothetical protein